MKPPTIAFLEKSRRLITHAEKMLQIELFEDAGRTAYLSGYHAAQALIFERDDKVFKTHRGVQSEFARIVRNDPALSVDFQAFLGRAYKLKSIADYETGFEAEVTQGQAQEAVVAARQFLGTIQGLLGGAPRHPPKGEKS